MDDAYSSGSAEVEAFAVTGDRNFDGEGDVSVCGCGACGSSFTCSWGTGGSCNGGDFGYSAREFFDSGRWGSEGDAGSDGDVADLCFFYIRGDLQFGIISNTQQCAGCWLTLGCLHG